MRALDEISSMIIGGIATADQIWNEGADYILKVLAETNEYTTEVKTPEQMYGALKWILQNKQYLVINGVLLDMFSASAVWQVVHALKKEENRLNLLGRSVTNMVEVAFKLIKR